MYKKVCDRCGKEITEGPKNMPEYWYEIVKYIDCGDTHRTIDHRIIDLCDGCLAEFERFLSGESLVGRSGDPLYDPTLQPSKCIF